MLSRGAGAREVKPLVKCPAAEGQAVVSPGSKWVAYTSAESGRTNLFGVSLAKDGTLGKLTASSP